MDRDSFVLPATPVLSKGKQEKCRLACQILKDTLLLERFPDFAFRLISLKKAHTLIACEVLCPRSNLQEDEAWAVLPWNNQGLLSHSGYVWKVYRKLFINSRNSGAEAQFITGLFCTGCTNRHLH
jgi:hypothetical protein